MAALLIPKEKISIMKWVSVTGGLIGIVILIGPDLSLTAGSSSTLGALALLGAAASFAGSLILIKRLPNVSSILAMRNVLGIATLLLIPLAFLFEDPGAVNLSMKQLLAVVILGVFHAGIVYLLYSILIQKAGAVFASLNNYLVPLFGVLLGTLFLSEQLSMTDIVSLLIIFASLGAGGLRAE
ncbi:DMT family transporter [Paenibacillus eucommiae]|uniref:Drug/metabolite transporter (DMT)-like permease n=1 Tax=Paenibacillus eucommiae TaxID=1355755 RepID=A0ABS4IQR9_9BACL|nr:DMT family transporter [Paenibacillus eucommiae]MBP1989863.1 drug/metabolite transporter (DMT)-like permease [Paenibacillus eucommiae]